MALYLGNDKIKLKIGNVTRILNLTVATPEIEIEGIRLKSSDGFVLKDSNGVLLLAKESE